ncbi:MAG: putative transporter ATP-binding protein [Actinomycetia bacterium]|nr:putative transporter ATP-binding protein [Actinomycetes bacterium]
MKPTRQHALVATGLTKNYDDVVALHDFSATIDEGELVTLVGHNGSGKSTLLGIVSGVLEPTSGNVIVAGAAPGSLEARAAVSYVPDNPVLYDDLSVWEHIAYIAALHGTVGWEDRAPKLLEQLGLWERVDDLPSRFSRGLRQKTMLAVGLIRPFSLLLVDEPFVGLDPSGQAAIVDLMLEAVEAGATVLASTHQQTLLAHATRCIGLRDGETVFDGPAGSKEAAQLLSADLGGSGTAPD